MDDLGEILVPDKESSPDVAAFRRAMQSSPEEIEALVRTGVDRGIALAYVGKNRVAMRSKLSPLEATQLKILEQTIVQQQRARRAMNKQSLSH